MADRRAGERVRESSLGKNPSWMPSRGGKKKKRCKEYIKWLVDGGGMILSQRTKQENLTMF